jgi:hypothetical protein
MGLSIFQALEQARGSLCGREKSSLSPMSIYLFSRSNMTLLVGNPFVLPGTTATLHIQDQHSKYPDKYLDQQLVPAIGVPCTACH